MVLEYEYTSETWKHFWSWTSTLGCLGFTVRPQDLVLRVLVVVTILWAAQVLKDGYKDGWGPELGKNWVVLQVAHIIGTYICCVQKWCWWDRPEKVDSTGRWALKFCNQSLSISTCPGAFSDGYGAQFIIPRPPGKNGWFTTKTWCAIWWAQAQGQTFMPSSDGW